MSSGIAILNSKGVAIAADSAVTIGTDNNIEKTYYTEQKIFQMCNKHAVGIMVFGYTKFMGIDWEIIFNEFKKYAENTNFNSLEKCVNEFLTVFLRDFKYITETKQKDFLVAISYWFFEKVKKLYDEEISKNYKNEKLTKKKQNKILQDILKNVKQKLDNSTGSSGFVDSDGFIKNNQNVIIESLNEVFDDFLLNEKNKDILIEYFHMDLIKLEIGQWYNTYSQIVFAGYGSDDIVPAVVKFDIYAKFGESVLSDNYMLYYYDHDIDNNKIIPCAQAKTINNVIFGIATDYELWIYDELAKFTNEIVNMYCKKNAEEIDKMREELKQKIRDYSFNKYYRSISNMVASLPKSELADMAEAMINITSLMQHVSADQKTVGGPTDVALITKTDGFVWIKKK